ncbi:MAG: HOG (high osmolarity glycerol) pathway protein [Alyxoria varia]|nr:MAG: HOG (high osmolarity glycerol) pathway protein [Alyxoria varia]
MDVTTDSESPDGQRRPREASPSNSTPRPRADRSSHSNPSFSSLPPLVTSSSARHGVTQRIPSYANKRFSTFSNSSGQFARSRPQSTVFPAFHSSLNYALVRDFAYATNHPMHYGPTHEPESAASTNASDFARRLSDPPAVPWQGTRGPWSGIPESVAHGGPQLPAMAFGDGPPWQEDDDLLSPIVTSTKHRKAKSEMIGSDYFSTHSISPANGGRRTSFAGVNTDGTETYYVDHQGETLPDGPGGEFIDIPSTESSWDPHDSANTDSSKTTYLEPYSHVLPSASPDFLNDDNDSRYSRDYSFTIASPDEEMHGKAVALFDFAKENENELPLVEGQVLWVSYRHGQGWLVAQDPKSGESGLVPEEYVRLVRDIQGGLNGLNGQFMSDGGSPVGAPDTPTAPPTNDSLGNGNNGSQHYLPVVSHFSTSSRDIHPYPQHHLLGSQANTPTTNIDSQLGNMSLDEKRGLRQDQEQSEEETDTEEESSQDDHSRGKGGHKGENIAPLHGKHTVTKVLR